jgi:CRP-like cAMP-binding protein
VRTAGGADLLEMPLDGLDEVLEEHFSVWLASARALASWQLSLRPPSPEARSDRRATGDPDRLVERLAAMQRAMPFARGHVDALVRLDEQSTLVRRDAGELLWHPGEAADHLLVPLEGEIQGVSPDEPCGIGGLELLSRRFRSAPLLATRPLTALRIEREALLDLFEDDHELARDLLAVIAGTVVEVLG